MKKKINQSNKSWICTKLFIPEDKKMRDYDHVT